MEDATASASYELFQRFLKKFTDSIDPDDQLPLRVSSYSITESEFLPEVINFARQYLQESDCPTVLLNAIVNNVLVEVQNPPKDSPLPSGFEPIQNNYQPLKLMQAVISKVNSVCTRLLDNAELMKLVSEDCLRIQNEIPSPKYAALGVKNSRRKMEDRHVVIPDFQELYQGKKSARCSYYGLFDGHGGAEAAIYCVAHMANNLRNSIYYPDDAENAITDAFLRTDEAFISKSQTDSLRSGTTALVVLHFPEEKMMHVAWTGDSQALIVKNGETVQLVNSHKASRQSERERIEALGGEIFALQGIDRVMGLLAITRAIGDQELKSYITAEPEIVSFELEGDEDFLIMASDGLWDGVSEDAAASEVYNRLKEDPDCYETIPKKLVQLAKDGSSSDNITVIVIYLKDPNEIAKFSWPPAETTQLDNMETTTDPNAFGSYNFEDQHFNGMNGSSATTTTTTTMNNNKFIEDQQNMEFDGNDNLLNFEAQTTTTTTKCVMDADDLMTSAHPEPPSAPLDNEFGPETDVDAVDEAMLMSSPHSVSQEDDQMLANEFHQFEQKEEEEEDQFIEEELKNPPPAAINPFTDNVFGLPKEVLGCADDEADADPVLESVPVDEDDEVAAGVVVSDEDLVPVNSSGPDEEDHEQQQHLGVQPDIVEGAAAAAGTAANVDSEGESDDEWNFVKPQPTANEAESEHVVKEEPEEPQQEEQQQQQPKEEEQEKLPEEELVVSHQEEQHAEAQAIAESQEHCAELNFEQPPTSDATETAPVDEHLTQVDQEHFSGPSDHLLDSEEDKKPFEDLLTVDTEQKDESVVSPAAAETEEDMSSQLNPDAVEFVPLSPQSSAPVSPALKMDIDLDSHDQFKGSPVQAPLISAIIDEDRILAQSPRKNNGNTAQLENVALPDEREFDQEISNRPHEWSSELIQPTPKQIDLNGSAMSNGDAEMSMLSQQSHHLVEDDVVDDEEEESGTLNSKEERDLDEEKEELRDEVIKEIIDNIPEELNGHANEDLLSAAVPGEQDPMNMSFHQDVQLAPTATNPFDLNAVQLLPDDIEEEDDERSAKGDQRPEVEQRMEVEEEVKENPLPESDLAQEQQQQPELTESESNFYLQQPEEEPEQKEFDEKEELAALQAEEAVAKSETPPPTPAATNDVQVPDLLNVAASPEPQLLVEAVEKLAVTEAEPTVEEPKKAEEEESSVAPVAAVAAATVLGGAVAAVVAVTGAAKDKPAAPAAAKKATTTTLKPKTPNTLGVKSSASTTSRVTPTKTTAAPRVSMTKSSPATARATPRTATTTTTAARSPLTEKKPASATTPTSAAKRSALTPSRPSTASSLSGASPKPSTPTRVTATTRTPTTASPKPATTSRLSTAAKPATSTTGAAATKRPTSTGTGTGLASRTLASKTATSTTSATARPKTTSGVTTTTTTTVKKTTVTSSLSAASKPKTSTTTTTTTSRLTNGTKPATTTTASRVSATKTTPTTRAPLSSSARPASATTTATASSAAKKPIGSASARASAVSAPSSRLTATKRVPGKTTTTTTSTTKTAAAAAAPAKGSKPTPITKRNVVETTTTKTTTTVVVENGAGVTLNGDAALAKELILNGDGGAAHDVAAVNGNGYGDGVESEGKKMVIDLTAD